jgi:hypothetical protein
LKPLLVNQTNEDHGVSSAINGGTIKIPNDAKPEAGIDVPDLSEPGPPPRYTINLSLPPRQRYSALAKAYQHKLVQLPILFDKILENYYVQNRLLHPKPIKQLARLLLRRIHDPEQMEELVGIQEATDIPMYLLVAFNTLLDMLVGCTSGGVRTIEKGKGRARGNEVRKMLHFRTLDWAMDPLRQIAVDLEFVSHPGGPVVARSITYLGFVGVLTGVRYTTQFNSRRACVFANINGQDWLKYIFQFPIQSSIVADYVEMGKAAICWWQVLGLAGKTTIHTIHASQIHRTRYSCRSCRAICD